MKKLQGGISQNGSIYYKNENCLAIYGWLYPRSSYDQISVYYNNKHIGNASLGIDRPDVFQHYPTEEGMKSGFKFSVKLDDFDTQDPVVFLVVKKGTEVITSLIENVTVYKYCNKFTECIEKYKLLPNERTDSFLFTRWIDSDDDAEYYRTGIYEGLFKRLENTEKNGHKIVVSGENWYSLCAELEEKGYIPLKDFIPIWYYFFIKDSRIRFDVIVNELDDQKALEYIDFLKKLGGVVFLYGNCQVKKLGEILAKDSGFAKDYIVVDLPTIFSINGKWLPLIRKMIKKADILIYQNIDVNNRFSGVLSTQYLLSACKEDCKLVCIPNMYFRGYWPQYCKNKYAYLTRGYDVCPYGDSNLNSAYEKGESLENVLKNIENEQYYSEETCEKNVADSLLELKNREDRCDIKISDYIAKYYKKDRLFYAVNHPTLQLYYEMVKRILYYLDYKNPEFSSKTNEQDGIEVPIYPSVAKGLGLEFEIKPGYFYKHFFPQKLSMYDWMKKYINYCFEQRPSNI